MQKAKWNWYKISLSTLILIICAAALFTVWITHTYAAISETELKQRMYQYCEEQLGYTQESLELYNFMHKIEGGWAFSLKIKNADPTTNGLVTGDMKEDGQLVSLEGPRSITVFEQLRVAILASQRYYETMYQLKLEWEPRLDQLSAEDLAEFDNPVTRNWQLIPLIHHDIRLPAQQDISYEEARKNAEDAILALPGWTQEMLNCMAIRLEVYHVPVHSDKAVYQFVYSTASSASTYDYHYGEKSISDAAFDKLMDDEHRIFGEVNLAFVSVRIDAQTGDLAGDIIVETHPTSVGAPQIYVLWK